MVNIEFKGHKFTWSRGMLAKRLDRAICNDEWIVTFKEASVIHLLKIQSDHRPILARFGRPKRRSQTFSSPCSLVNGSELS